MSPSSHPPPALDLSTDVATLLREGTAAAHRETENSPGALSLVRGELDKHEYTRFLIIMWHVYSTLEDALELHAAHPVLAPTYNPTILARAPALSADISHLLAIPEPSWPSHPLALAIARTPPAPLSAYTQRIRTLGADPARLLAHAYVRYLGDLSGGQVIRRRIRRAYGLDDDDGTRFYEFQKLGGGRAAGPADMRELKAWFRAGMNDGVGDDAERKAALIAEANTAFGLNAGILSSLCTPARPSSSGSEQMAGERPVVHGMSVASVISLVLANAREWVGRVVAHE